MNSNAVDNVAVITPEQFSNDSIDEVDRSDGSIVHDHRIDGESDSATKQRHDDTKDNAQSMVSKVENDEDDTMDVEAAGEKSIESS